MVGVKEPDVRLDNLLQKERRAARVFATGEEAIDCSSEGDERSEDDA